MHRSWCLRANRTRSGFQCFRINWVAALDPTLPEKQEHYTSPCVSMCIQDGFLLDPQTTDTLIHLFHQVPSVLLRTWKYTSKIQQIQLVCHVPKEARLSWLGWTETDIPPPGLQTENASRWSGLASPKVTDTPSAHVFNHLIPQPFGTQERRPVVSTMGQLRLKTLLFVSTK